MTYRLTIETKIPTGSPMVEEDYDEVESAQARLVSHIFANRRDAAEGLWPTLELVGRTPDLDASLEFSVTFKDTMGGEPLDTDRELWARIELIDA